MINDMKNMLLCKTTFDTSDIKPEYLNSKKCYIDGNVVLGYYDYMYIYDIDYKTQPDDIFVSIKKENKLIDNNLSRKILYHPVCCVITDETNQKKSDIDEFWDCESIFLCCTSVHISKLSNIKIQEVFEYLKNKIEIEKFVIYNSLGFSDFIIFWKTDDLQSDIEKASNISNLNNIDYCNTIVSINAEYPQFVDNDCLIDRFRINVTTYFNEDSCKIVENVCSIFSSTNKNYVNGNNSCCIEFNEVKIKDVIQFSKFVKYKIADQKKPSMFFLNSTLDVNEKEFFKNYNKKKSENTQLQTKYEKLSQEYFLLSKKINNNEAFDSFGQLLNLLHTMASNSLYSSSCIILYNSVKYIKETFESLLKNKKIQNRKSMSIQKRFIDRLMRGCWTYIDSSLNQELSYMQELRYRPLVTNMNVNLLELYNGLFYFATKYLTTADNENKDEILESDNEMSAVKCLIVPKMCRRVKTFVHDDRDMDSLLFIDMPLNVAFDTKIATISIVHEISHYWGDYFRMREKRKYAFLNSVSEALAYETCYSNKVAARIYRELENSVSSIYFFDEMKKRLFLCAKRSFSDDDFVCELATLFIDDCFKMQEYNYDKIEEVGKLVANNRCTLFATTGINRIIDDISYFIRECYADLCMINLMNIDVNAYLKMFEYESNLQTSFDDKTAMLIQRIVIVLLVLSEKNGFDIQSMTSNFHFKNEIVDLYNYFSFKKNSYNDEDEFNELPDDFEKKSEYYYCFGVVEPIINYLECCWDRMSEYRKKTVKAKDMATNIEKFYKYLTSREFIFHNKYYELLQECYCEFVKDAKD